jgi:hypothetical protein
MAMLNNQRIYSHLYEILWLSKTDLAMGDSPLHPDTRRKAAAFWQETEQFEANSSWRFHRWHPIEIVGQNL